jgi:hypothetical protein
MSSAVGQSSFITLAEFARRLGISYPGAKKNWEKGAYKVAATAIGKDGKEQPLFDPKYVDEEVARRKSDPDDTVR